MKKQNNKRTKTISTLAALVIGLTIMPAAFSSSEVFTKTKDIVINDRLQEAKPIAGRNRRRAKSTTSISLYPKANLDRVRASRQFNKLRINVLSNDNGYKLRVIDINPRSAVGAKVSVKNGMAVYQVPEHFVGKDSFWYTMQDKSGRQHSAKVIVCICDK